MKMKILDGKILADKLLSDLKQTIIKEKLKLKLVAIQIGSINESNIYLKLKAEKAKEIGISFEVKHFENDAKLVDILNLIKKLNLDPSVNGIIVQLPLPKKMDLVTISQSIVPWKDVDGFNPLNKGQLDLNQLELVPPTAMATISIIESYNISLDNKIILVIGRGEIAGKPIVKMLLNKNAIVISVGHKIRNLKQFTKQADIIISAVGEKNLVNASMIKNNVGLVNIGITKNDEVVFGDIDENKLKNKASWLIPAVGGVGPLTVAYLLINTYKCYIIKSSNDF